jgi:hypothetical protein
MTRITRPRIHHTDDIRFIVNTAALNNYQHILSAIPRSLLPHSFAVLDQVALRAAAAAQIRDRNNDSDDEVAVPLDDTGLGESSRTVLADPAFPRGGTRARKQLLKPVPTTL